MGWAHLPLRRVWFFGNLVHKIASKTNQRSHRFNHTWLIGHVGHRGLDDAVTLSKGKGELNMKSLGEMEESLAKKAEPVLGFKPSSKFKRGPIGILIYVVCGIIAFFSMKSAGLS